MRNRHNENMEINNQDDFGVFLKRYRFINNLSQKEMSDKLGVPQQSISRLEIGKMNPSLSVMINYLTKLGYKIQIIKKDGADTNEK